MGRTIELLLPAVVLAAVIYFVASVMASRQNRSLSHENKRLEAENAKLRTDESTKVQEVRAELAASRNENSELHSLLDHVLQFAAQEVNPLDTRAHLTDIVTYIITHRPTKRNGN